MNAEGHHSRCPSIVQCYPETICAATIRSLFSPLSRGVAREREGNPSGGVTWWTSLRRTCARLRDPCLARFVTTYLFPSRATPICPQAAVTADTGGAPRFAKRDLWNSSLQVEGSTPP